jgi:hypothetical protein
MDDQTSLLNWEFIVRKNQFCRREGVFFGLQQRPEIMGDEVMIWFVHQTLVSKHFFFRSVVSVLIFN